MSSQKQVVTTRDLIEEAKKRIVILVICVVGLSYLMSLTSSSVWVNLPAAACLIFLLRYFSLDLEMKRKAAAYNRNSSPVNKPPELPKEAPRSDWRSKVNSKVVEDAMDGFSRHLISEWVTDLWYSRITPDKQGPEELVFIINSVLGEISWRYRNVNLIDLLTRDLIEIVCRNLELFRESQSKIEKSLTFEERDSELRRVMDTEDKLHPALFSPESEHKVLQHLTNSLISLTFKPHDLQCSFFRYTVRELLSCCVLRPILNLANPRFINERIEGALKSRIQIKEGIRNAGDASQSDDISNMLPDLFARYANPSAIGVELVQLKNEQPNTDKQKITDLSKDPLLSIDTRSSLTWNSFPSSSKNSEATEGIKENRGKGEWSDVLDLMSQRKTETLAPENLESVWAKGKNYKMKDGEKQKAIEKDPKKPLPGRIIPPKFQSEDIPKHEAVIGRLPNDSSADDDDDDDDETESSHSYTSEDEEKDNVMGLNSPETRVWDGRTKRNLGVSHIHHPLENSKRRYKKKGGKGHQHYPHLTRMQSSRKRSRFFSGQTVMGHMIGDDDRDDSESEPLGRSYSETSASLSGSYFSLPESGLPNALKSSLMVDSFAKLRCEVLDANIVESSSKMFAVYSIAVTDESNRSWSIKRRFRHFEELHHRLRVFPEYSLHLPPKHFLSTGLDIHVIEERCVLLDDYLKKLLQLPRVSGSIEVWDFLSVDSQTYSFSSSFSIIQMVTAKPTYKPSSTTAKNMQNASKASLGPQPHGRENVRRTENGKSARKIGNNVKVDDDLKPKVKSPDKDDVNSKKSGLKEESGPTDGMTIHGLPTEWVPPKLTLPLLDLVDVVFQLREGGWIRRKAFWVAKQILQLGMGDALDDWLLEKIRLLRRGTVVASGIQRVEQILWPDGIFITKHPKRQQQPQPQESNSSKASSPRLPQQDQHQSEADSHAKFVYELMIDKAPATIVNLVGHKEYERCAKDLYFFLQSSICLKQLAFDLLELLLLAAFPEMEQTFKQLHQDKLKFRELHP